MRVKDVIDFKSMDWSKVDREKAEFFYNEAVEFNDRLIANINNLNGKALSLLATGLPVLSAAVGFLLSVWGDTGKEPLSMALIAASTGMFITLVLLILAVFPRGVYLGKGTPQAYFTDNFYKADLHHLFSFGIAALNKYINHNREIEAYRGRFLLAGILAFVATPLVTVGVFLIRHLNGN
jgi:hypothetical protein